MTIPVGMCWFDDPVLAGAGWASVAGDEPYRIESHGALRTDVVWATNLTYPNYRKLNLVQSPHIFDMQLFRTSTVKIAEELGLLDDVAMACQTVAEVGNRVAKLGNSIANIDISGVNYRYANTITNKMLPDYARQRPAGAKGSEICEAFKQSTQENQAMSGGARPANAKAYSFLFARNAYFRWLLSQPVPISNQWDEVKQRSGVVTIGFEDGKVLSGTKSVLQKLNDIGKDHCAFFQVNVQSIDPFYEPFASFGSGSMNPRRWASLPEIIHMANYCKISLMDGYMSKSGRLDIPQDLLKANPYSYSHGLLLENIWAGLAGSLYGGEFKSSVGAYLRAYDRICCNTLAAKLAGFNATIGSYGSGRLVVFVRPGEDNALANFALSEGLCPPLALLKGASK